MKLCFNNTIDINNNQLDSIKVVDNIKNSNRIAHLVIGVGLSIVQKRYNSSSAEKKGKLLKLQLRSIGF